MNNDIPGKPNPFDLQGFIRKFIPFSQSPLVNGVKSGRGQYIKVTFAAAHTDTTFTHSLGHIPEQFIVTQAPQPGSPFTVITSITGTAPITVSAGSTPVVALTTPLAIVYGGTGSATQNFVDLTTAQNVGGVKTFTSPPVMSGAGISASSIANASLANSTISGVALGGTLGTLTFGAHLASGGASYNGSAGVTITSDATALNTASTIMLRDGSGQVAATTFTGALSGNATTATKLATARAINGVNFDGSAAITIKATATNALTFGTHLASGGASYDGSAAVTITSDAASANTASTIVARDASGNFSMGTLTATSASLTNSGGTASATLGVADAGSYMQFNNAIGGSSVVQLGNGSTNFGATGPGSVSTDTLAIYNNSGFGRLQLALDHLGNMAVAGRFQSASDGTTTSYVPPAYVAAGTASASTMHIVADKVTASGLTTTVTLSGAAAFASATYLLVILDESGLSYIAPTAQAAGSFTFASVNTRVYSFFCIGA